MRHCTLTLLILSLVQPTVGDQIARPRALTAFEEARRALESGRIEWSVLPEGDLEQAIAFVSRYARNGDMIFEMRGDKDGWTRVNRDGTGVTKYPQLFLIKSENQELWYQQETSPNVSVYPKFDPRKQEFHRGIRDIRALGVYPTSGSVDLKVGLDWLWGREEDPFVSFRERRDGDHYIVTGRSQHGALVTWHINAARGWNAERIEYEAGELGVWEAVSTLEKLGEAWFPSETRFYENGRLVESVVVNSGAFNLPSDKSELTPSDLGLEPGTNIWIHDEESNSRRIPPVWNGESAMPLREFWRDVEEGRRTLGPTFARMREKGFSSPYDTPEQIEQRRATRLSMMVRSQAESHHGAWESYVRDFISRYALDEEQRQRAWTILLDCRQRAEAIMQPQRNEMLAAISEYLAAREADDPQQEALAAKINRMREPIDRIFETQLKPRLDKLPTRAQRKAAETAAASQPSPARRSSPRRRKPRLPRAMLV